MANFVKMYLTEAAEEKFKRHLRDRVMALKDGLTELHETKITKWRAAYEAKPKEEVREFPYYGAHNLIVPIIAIFSDTLLARVMSAILKTKPPFVAKLYGTHPDITEAHRTSLEDMMEYVSVEPDELDLFRVYHEWFGETIKYGTSVVMAPHEVRYRYELDETAGDGTGSYSINKQPTFIKTLDYEGPRPEKIEFEDFLIPPAAKTIDAADIIVRRRKTTRAELEERRFFQVYDPAKVDAIMHEPDRTGPDYVQQIKEQTLGATTESGHGYAEWDLYECWLKWPTPDGKFRPRTIATYHLASNTLLRGLYDTHTLLPFSLARLFYRDGQIYGYGYCETMWSFQEETSEIHNSRLDNRTVSNTRAWRVSPDSKLHAGYRFYPNCTVPAEKDEVEAMSMGDVSNQSIDDERENLELAERRAGVSPPMQGFGTGSMGKRGVYNSMGTLALMQEGNRRTDLNISDFRYAHTRLGRIILADYAKYGVSARLLDMFGGKAGQLAQAVGAVKEGRLGLPVYSSTASLNREVEKQNDYILVNIMRQHYIGVGQLVAQINNQTTPPDLKEYLIKVVKASNVIMKSVLRNFDKEDIDTLVPDVEFPNDQNQAGQTPPAGGNGQTGSGLPFVLPNPGLAARMAGGGGPQAAPGAGPLRA